MATYTRIVFSQQAFNDEMLRICDQALDDAISYILTNEWFVGSAPQEVGGNNMDSYFEIPTNSLKAWIIEYGQGQGADTSRNPYWDSYLESGYTSPMRNGGTVVKRGSAPYVSIDFEHNKIREHESGSSPEGQPLNDGMQKALKREPHPFIQDLLKQSFVVFKNSFNNYVENFNIQKCFITTQVGV